MMKRCVRCHVQYHDSASDSVRLLCRQHSGRFTNHRWSCCSGRHDAPACTAFEHTQDANDLFKRLPVETQAHVRALGLQYRLISNQEDESKASEWASCTFGCSLGAHLRRDYTRQKITFPPVNLIAGSCKPCFAPYLLVWCQKDI